MADTPSDPSRISALDTRARSWTSDDVALLDMMPLSLWLLDFSGLKTLFDQWRGDGVSELAPWLAADITRISSCLSSLRLVLANRYSRKLAGAYEMRKFLASSPSAAGDAALTSYASVFVSLWNGETQFGARVQTLGDPNPRVDLNVRGIILSGHEANWSCVMLVFDDVSAEEQTRRQLAESEAYARTLFDQSPVSLWVEDFSAIKHLLDQLRSQGVTDIAAYLSANPAFVELCAERLRIIDINAHTLQLFGAADKAIFRAQMPSIFRDDTFPNFKEELVELWQGKLQQQREVRNYTMTGEALDLVLQLSVLPGHEHDWSLVLIGLTDITARKTAEFALEYLGKHDALTGLRNRSSYIEEIGRLERHGPFPITVIVADLNGLKKVNDEQGHAAGDALLQRAGDVFRAALPAPSQAARTGGDEFAILLPATNADEGARIIARIKAVAARNNQQYQGAPLSLSIGMATSDANQLETTIHQADLRMYAAKRAFYAGQPADDQRQP